MALYRSTSRRTGSILFYYFAFEPNEALGKSGSDGPLYRASAGGKLGIDISEARIRDYIQQGLPVQFRVVVDSSLGEHGAVLSFDLQPARQGYKITNLHVAKVNNGDDGLIAFMFEQSGNQDIYTMRTDGSLLTNITNNPANDHSPLWSPDGRRIAFISERTGNADIFTMDTDGSQLVRSTDNPGYDGFFSWSPDGKKIVYTAGKEDIKTDNSYLWILIRTQRLFSLTPVPICSWAGPPMAKKIVYQKQNPETDGPPDNIVAVMNIDGTDYHEWNFIVDRIQWEDDQHFIGDGWNGQSENPGWVLRQFNINGDPPVEIAFHSSPIVELLKDTHVVESGTILAWYSSDGNPTPYKY